MRYAVVDPANKVIAITHYEPDADDLATRSEVPVGPLDATVDVDIGYVYDPGTQTFAPPPPPPRTMDTAVAEKTEEIQRIRQQKIAAVLGTSAAGLADREAYFLRLAAVAADMQANPSAWYGRVLDGAVLGSTDAEVLAAAQQILDAQRQRNDAIEVVISEYRQQMAQIAAATTVDEVDAVTWA